LPYIATCKTVAGREISAVTGFSVSAGRGNRWRIDLCDVIGQPSFVASFNQFAVAVQIPSDALG
jgi:hypothetical protein